MARAGLFLRNLANLQHIDLGFRRDHVLLVTLDPPRTGHGDERLARRYAALLDRMQRIPACVPLPSARRLRCQAPEPPVLQQWKACRKSLRIGATFQSAGLR